MTSDARTEAEAFAKLQEAATGPKWIAKRFDESQTMILPESHNPRHPLIANVSSGEGRPDAQANTDLITAARNTALPRLTLELVAENERLREDLKQLQDAVKPFADAWHEAVVETGKGTDEVTTYKVNMPTQSATWFALSLAYHRSFVPAEQRPLLAELEQKLGLKALQGPSR